MSTLLDVAYDHQQRRDVLAATTAARATRLFRRLDPQNLDMGWQFLAPTIAATVAEAQVTAARQATRYSNAVATLQDVTTEPAALNPAAFGGVTIDGRELTPELYGAVTTTKKLVGAGVAVPAAFRSGAQMMSLLAATVIRDMGRSADSTIAVAKGFTYSVRVINPGACSRCAILAGVKGYRTDFDRHPGCKCSSMPLMDADDAPAGFHRSPDDYFQSLSEAEQDRIFTKSGAAAIRLGADPTKVVNARRGAYKMAKKRPDGSFAPSRLRPIRIGTKRDGSPLNVYATTEGTTSRGMWGRGQSLTETIRVGDRYRRTSTLRLMPEQIMSMASSPERARELLARYGYLA
jgi:hypothetical protein